MEPFDLVEAADAAHVDACAAQRRFLRSIGEIDRREAWRSEGAREMAHWLWMRYGVSEWKARRWLQAAHALETLPALSHALEAGELGVDKVVELTRFATPANERELIRWGWEVSAGAIRRRADKELRAAEEAAQADRERFLTWSYVDEGRRLAFEGEVAAAEGAVVVAALERVAGQIPSMPDEDAPYLASARRADALVALCSARLAADPDPDRATVIVHAQLDDDGALAGSGQLESGPSIARETVERWLCHGRVQTVVEDEAGRVLGLGRLVREPPAWMLRQVRHRDGECRFPGCGARRFTQAHHIRHWRHGGPTDLDNLLLICTFHHRLVHEHGWRVQRAPDGGVAWWTPEGRRYLVVAAPRAGPVSPEPIAV